MHLGGVSQGVPATEYDTHQKLVARPMELVARIPSQQPHGAVGVGIGGSHFIHQRVLIAICEHTIFVERQYNVRGCVVGELSRDQMKLTDEEHLNFTRQVRIKPHWWTEIL